MNSNAKGHLLGEVSLLNEACLMDRCIRVCDWSVVIYCNLNSNSPICETSFARRWIRTRHVRIEDNRVIPRAARAVLSAMHFKATYSRQSQS